MDRAGGEDVHIRAGIGRGVGLGQAATDLDEERLLLPGPVLLELAGRVTDSLRGEVVEHDDVGAGVDSRVGLLETAAFDLDFGRETARRLGRLHGAGDSGRDGLGVSRARSSVRGGAVVGARPDMVILEHGHGAEVVAVGVGAADKKAVFLDDAEARRGLAGAGERALPAVGAQGGNKGGTLGCDAGAAGEDVEGDALAEEDLADGAADGGAMLDRVDGFTFLDVPFNSASTQPSACFILFCMPGGGVVAVRAAQLGKDLVEKGYTCNDALVCVRLWTFILSTCIPSAYLALPQ